MMGSDGDVISPSRVPAGHRDRAVVGAGTPVRLAALRAARHQLHSPPDLHAELSRGEL